MVGDLVQLASPIVRAPGLPMHRQVAQALRDFIRENLAPQALIPTEGELEELFGVSRATIRRAIGDLVDEGLLLRQQGKGTFVRAPKLTYEPAYLSSWTESIRSLGLAPSTGTTRLREVPPPGWVREQLALQGDATVIWIWRLRLADAVPISIMVNYVAARRVPGLIERGLTRESLYDEYREVYGLPLTRVEDEVEAQLASDDEAALLEVQPGSPILEVRRTAFFADGQAAEVAVVRSRADRYRYRAAFVDRGVDTGHGPA